MSLQYIENTHIVQTCVSWVPALEGGAEKCDMLRNLAQMLSTCFKEIQGEMFSQGQEMETNTLSRWKQAFDFQQYLQIRLFTQHLEFGTCVWASVGNRTTYASHVAIVQVNLCWLHRIDVKPKVLWPHSCSLTSITSIPHIWTCIYLGTQFLLFSYHHFNLPWATKEVSD